MIELKPIDETHVQRIHELINDPQVAEHLAQVEYPPTFESTQEWVNRSLALWDEGKHWHYGIFEENNLVGMVGLEVASHHAKLWYWLGKEYWGNGYATQAVHSILPIAFNDLKLHRVMAFAFKENIASQRVLEKNNFICEGQLRDNVFVDGIYRSSKVYGLLEHEWKEKQKQ